MRLAATIVTAALAVLTLSSEVLGSRISERQPSAVTHLVQRQSTNRTTPLLKGTPFSISP
jgi:hypothetical protein